MDEIILEKHEHFIKQTYRNRCYVCGPNGKQLLVIPLQHENLFRIPICDVRISYNEPWNKIHWKTICTSYRNAPFFEYFEDEFQKIYENKTEFLFDFNLILLEKVFSLFKMKKNFHFTEKYDKAPASYTDLRNSFHPKNESKQVVPYHQVFSERQGFFNDVSCIDLLFNDRIS